MTFRKTIINFTPTGIIPTKKDTPFVPVTPGEIVKEILQARRYGVSMVHIHARDEDGKPTYRKEIYEKIISGIRSVDKRTHFVCFDEWTELV